MEEYLGADECTVYYGLRADEDRTGYTPLGKRHNITPAYPLRDHRIGLEAVYAILDANDLMPPDFFWERLFLAVDDAMIGWPLWQDKLSRVERAILFAGRSRANCFFCFFQRQYEFLWLYETHPDLFAAAESLEKDDYSFMHNFPLRKYHSEEVRWHVFGRRVADVAKAIKAKYQGNLFGIPADNEIALVSCGLLCGK